MVVAGSMICTDLQLKSQSLNCDFVCDTILFNAGGYTNLLSKNVRALLPNDIFENFWIRMSWKRARCNDTLEVMIDSFYLLGNSHLLDSLLVYEQNQNTVNSFVNLVILTWDPSISIGNCPENIFVAKIYSAACGVWVRCRYEVDPESRRCDSGFAEPYNDYSLNGKQYVDMLRWQSCGEVCCKKTYTLCRELLPSGEIKKTEIKEVGIQRHPQTPECTLQQQFRHPVTNQIIPCKDGC